MIRDRLSLLCTLGGMLWMLNGCQPAVAPVQQSQLVTRYSISPDTLAGSVYCEYGFAMLSSDSSWRAATYIWDFGDSTAPLKVRNANHASHIYQTVGTYRVSAIAMDSADNMIAQAHAMTEIGIPQTKVTVEPHSITTSSEAPQSFRAFAPPAVPISYYVWSFGDGTPESTMGYNDNVSHAYTHDGTYAVIVRGYSGNYIAGTDTCIVTVKLPSVSSNDLRSMNFVTSICQGDTHSCAFSLPLSNSKDNVFSISGLSFSVEHNGRSGSRFIDSSMHRLIGGTLSADGRYLIRTVSNYMDSIITLSGDTTFKHIMKYSYPCDTLKLVYLSPDSIVFRSLPLHYYGSGYSVVDSIHVPPPPPSGNNTGPGCDKVIPWDPRGSESYGEVTIVFWRPS